MAEGGFADLTAPQARVAARLDEHGTRLTTLAEASGLSKQATAHLVGQLERSGYVDRVADPADARAKLIRLSERGRAAQARAREMEAIIDAEWRRHLGSADYAQLRQALVNLRVRTEPYLHQS